MNRLALFALAALTSTFGCGADPAASIDAAASTVPTPDATTSDGRETTSDVGRADTITTAIEVDAASTPDVAPPDAEGCRPTCPEGAECGGDGCGGSCGSCGERSTCNIDRCVCFAECGARECGPEPVCGRSCGSCGIGLTCVDGSCVGGVADRCLGGRVTDDCATCATGAHCWDFATLDGGAVHACGSPCDAHADCPEGWMCESHGAGRACAPRAEERCEGRAWVYERCGRSVAKRADCGVACCERQGEATCVGEGGVGCRVAMLGAQSLGIRVFSCEDGWLVDNGGVIAPGSVLDDDALDCGRYCELTRGTSGTCVEEIGACSGDGPDGEPLCQGPVSGSGRLEVGRCVCDDAPPPEPEQFGVIRLVNPNDLFSDLCATSPTLSDTYWMFAYSRIDGGAWQVLGPRMQLDVVVRAGAHVLDIECCLSTGWMCPGSTGDLCDLGSEAPVVCGCVHHQIGLEVEANQIVGAPLCGL